MLKEMLHLVIVLFLASAQSFSIPSLSYADERVPTQVSKEFQDLDKYLVNVRVVEAKNLSKDQQVVVFEATANQFEHQTGEGHKATRVSSHPDQAFGVFVSKSGSVPKKLAIFWSPRNLDFELQITKASPKEIHLSGRGATYADSCTTWVFKINKRGEVKTEMGECELPPIESDAWLD